MSGSDRTGFGSWETTELSMGFGVCAREGGRTGTVPAGGPDAERREATKNRVIGDTRNVTLPLTYWLLCPWVSNLCVPQFLLLSSGSSSSYRIKL